MASVEIEMYKIGENPEPIQLDIGNEPRPILPSDPSITAHEKGVLVKEDGKKQKWEFLVITYPWERMLILHKGLIAQSVKGESEDKRTINVPLDESAREFYVRNFGPPFRPEYTIRILPEKGFQIPVEKTPEKKYAKRGK